MKKTLFTLGLTIAATLTLTNCAKQEAILKDAEPAKQGVPFELVAGIDTKTTAESLSSIKWAANDAIAVFHTDAGSDKYGTNDKFTIAEEDLASTVVVPATASISDIVGALNAVGATARDTISILQAMKAAGAIHADLEII